MPKLICPSCGEIAHRAYIQVDGQTLNPKREGRPFVPMIGFVYCRNQKAMVREEDAKILTISPYR